MIYNASSGSMGKEPACKFRRHRRCRFDPWVRNILLKRKWLPTPVLLPGKSHGQRSQFTIVHQFSSVAQSCPTLCDPMDSSMPGFLVLHQLPEFTQTLLHWVSNAIKPSHPLSSPSPPDFNLSLHQGLFKWVSSLHQVAKVLELHHQSFQWIFRIDFL